MRRGDNFEVEWLWKKKMGGRAREKFIRKEAGTGLAVEEIL